MPTESSCRDFNLKQPKQTTIKWLKTSLMQTRMDVFLANTFGSRPICHFQDNILKISSLMSAGTIVN